MITDSSSDIETIVKNALSLTDNGEKMDKLNLVLNLSNLTDAMAQNTYGNIVCEATATDKYNNKSTAFRILISYEKDDVEAPVITVVTPGTANVDLTGITTETERRNKMLNAAIAGVIKGTHYTVTDDVSAGAELNCEVTGEYSGNTTAGTHDVTLTITVTDKSGKSSTALITVTVTVVDNTAATSANVAQE